MSMGVQRSLQDPVSFPSGKNPQGELLDHIGILLLIGGIFTWFVCFSITAVSIYIPFNSTQMFLFSTSCQHLLSFAFLVIAILPGIKVLSHRDFDLHFPD